MTILLPADKITKACTIPPQKPLLLDVQQCWRLISVLMSQTGVPSYQEQIGMLATLAVESQFKPTEEIGDANYFWKQYHARPDYVTDATGKWKWRGRGYIQLSGLDNYEQYSKIIKVDIASNPSLALIPEVAAKLAVAYWDQHSLAICADRGDWVELRQLVNGGTNGVDYYLGCIWKLMRVAYPA